MLNLNPSTAPTPVATSRSSEPSTILYRITGALLILTSLVNILFSALWVLSLIWVLVGVIRLIPLLVSIIELRIGVAMVMHGDRHRFTALAPILSPLSSVMNFNLLGLLLDILAILTGGIGFLLNATVQGAPAIAESQT